MQGKIPMVGHRDLINHIIVKYLIIHENRTLENLINSQKKKHINEYVLRM